MFFKDILYYFDRGYEIQRTYWENTKKISKNNPDANITVNDLLANDWVLLGVNFNVALTAFLKGKRITRVQYKKDPTKYICFHEGKIYIGLGCLNVPNHHYTFTEEDIKAEDWYIVD